LLRTHSSRSGSGPTRNANALLLLGAPNDDQRELQPTSVAHEWRVFPAECFTVTLKLNYLLPSTAAYYCWASEAGSISNHYSCNDTVVHSCHQWSIIFDAVYCQIAILRWSWRS
jgi:hypothetical protein